MNRRVLHPAALCPWRDSAGIGEGINPSLSKSENIDSIKINKPGKSLTITSLSDIDRIVKVLQTAKKFDRPDRMNINTDFYDLQFFTKNKEEATIRILSNVYNGIVISANDYYYSGSDLNKVVTEIKTK
ncbi:MAG: hypothetical protein SFU87_04720 [Chitinophagaceae bacterium]|nr:hypothetical protein [Chitinophagaceae bacterium]